MSSDSEGEEHGFSGFYGKALEPYDEDNVPKKRAIPIEDQVAKDGQGRRRFHGAFTGGFSAGFFNTVGSLEGWRPSEFKSSRSSKAENTKQQLPQDYMDDEDLGEFGIAPQTVKATDEYNTSRKRKRQGQEMSDGPIPGVPVLQTLIDSGNETIGYLLLRHMGYKHSNEEEEEDVADVDVEEAADDSKRVYGCEMPKSYSIKKSFNNATFSISEIYKNALTNPKANSFGMGYQGLDRSHINLFTSSKLVVNEGNNKKLSISGQAFGVGAFEDDDEDIYVKEDLTKYDFELTGEKAKEKPRDSRKLILDMFVQARKDFPMVEKFLPPSIPSSFTGKHKVRKSRFAPQLPDDKVDKEKEAPKRHEIDAATRAMILGEGTSNSRREREVPKVNKVNTIKPTPPPTVEVKRESMFDVGPAGLIFDKFVSAGKSEEHADILDAVQPSETEHGTKDMRDAAKKKMFGPLTRIIISWLPNALLCKRFNVPEPVFSEADLKYKQKRHRNLIFESASVLDSISESGSIHEAGLRAPIEIADAAAASAANPPELPATTPAIETISAVSNNAARVSVTCPCPPSGLSVLAPTKPKVAATPALDPTERLDISKHVDLFKAVFMDSDSDEEDNGDNDKSVDVDKAARAHEEAERARNARDEEMKATILGEDLLLPQIKPIKQGILSNVASIVFDKPTAVEEPKQAQAVSEAGAPKAEIIDGDKNFINSDNMYGPRLPQKITFRKPEKSTNLLMQNAEGPQAGSADADWVEKGEEKAAEKKNKHKKQKHKKDKHKEKHKKHRKEKRKHD